MVFGGYSKHFQDENRPFAWLSRDRSIGDAYEADEKCNFIFTAAGFRDLFNLVSRCNFRSCFPKTPQSLPIMLISGDQDPVGGYGKGVRRVYEQYKKAGHTDLKLILYRNYRHEIFLELNKSDVFSDVSAWLEKNIQNQKGV